MKRPKIFFLADALNWKQCMLAKQAMKQAVLFAQKGYEVVLLTFDFDALYPYLRSLACQEGRLSKQISVRNMFEDLAGGCSSRYVHNLPVFDMAPFEEKGQVRKQTDTTYLIESGDGQDKKIMLTKQGSLSRIRHADALNRQCLEDFDPWGKLRRKTFLDEIDQVRQEIYYNMKGKACLSIWHNRKTGRPDKVHRLTDKGAIYKEYTGGLLKLEADWLQEVLAAEKHPFVISYGQNTDQVLMHADVQQAVKILHLDAHHKHPESDSEAAAIYRLLEESGFSNLDGVLLPTESQKKQLSSRFGSADKMYVIPYCPEQKETGLGLFSRLKKDKRLAVAISRFGSRQSCEQILKAFQLVLADHPEAVLHFYGKTSEKAYFTKVHEQLGLGKQAIFKAFEEISRQVCEPALFSIIPTKYGDVSFPVLESMSYRTPVINYHEKPLTQREDTEDGQYGFRVRTDSISKLAACMQQLFQYPAKTLDMGMKAKRYVDKHFSKDLVVLKWQAFVDDMLAEKDA